MTHQFTIAFSEEHARYAVRKFFLRYIGVGLPVMWGVMTAALAQMFVTGQTNWLFGALVVVLVMGVGTFIAAYTMRLKHSLATLKRMGSPLVSYQLTEERFKVSSGLGTTEVKWEMFKELWVFPRVWLLLFDKANYLTVPCEQLSDEAKGFLKQKIASVGGKIK